MAADKRSYADIKAELEELLRWFETDEATDIDQALIKHKQAEELLVSLEKKLSDAKQKINKA